MGVYGAKVLGRMIITRCYVSEYHYVIYYGEPLGRYKRTREFAELFEQAGV